MCNYVQFCESCSYAQKLVKRFFAFVSLFKEAALDMKKTPRIYECTLFILNTQFQLVKIFLFFIYQKTTIKRNEYIIMSCLFFQVSDQIKNQFSTLHNNFQPFYKLQTKLIVKEMLRSLNLFKCKVSRIKINDSCVSGGMLLTTQKCMKNLGVSDTRSGRYFFTSKKNNIQNQNQSQNIVQNAQQPLANQEEQKKKKPRRKRNRNNKKQQKTEQQSSLEPKTQQTEPLFGSKTKSFYKTLFSQDQQVKQQEKLLKMLQSFHQKSINNTHEQLTQKFDKTPKKKKKQESEKFSKRRNSSQQSIGQQQDPKPRAVDQPSSSRIRKLDDLILQANKQIEFPKIQQFEQKLFCVLDDKNGSNKMLIPFGFRYYLFRFTKYHVYLKQVYGKDAMMKYHAKCISTIRFYCLGKNDVAEKEQEKVNPDTNTQNNPLPTSQPSLSSSPDRLDYMQQFMTNLLPFQNTHQFSDIYLQVGLQYVKVIKHRLAQPKSFPPQMIIPSVNSLRMILTNLRRLMGDSDNFEVDDTKQEDYLLYRAFFVEYLDLFCAKKYKFQTADKVECVEIAKFLKVAHPQFMQFVKQFIQQALQNFSMTEFLVMLGYLVENKNTPYEYFYKQKGKWMNIIESSHDFSNKKTKCCIKLLEVFSRQRFINCEKIYHKLLQIITNNLQAMEGKELVRTLYYYSRTRYGSNPTFISNLIEKISRWLPYLQQRQFSLLVRSIGNLNYQSPQLVEQLKNINYERFLCELKYGCENLGSYYQEILKQVQTQSKRIYYFQGQENFYQSSQTKSENEQKSFQVADEKVI